MKLKKDLLETLKPGQYLLGPYIALGSGEQIKSQKVLEGKDQGCLIARYGDGKM